MYVNFYAKIAYKSTYITAQKFGAFLNFEKEI